MSENFNHRNEKMPPQTAEARPGQVDGDRLPEAICAEEEPIPVQSAKKPTDAHRKKRVSIPVCVAIVLLSCLATFMATFVILTDRYNTAFKNFVSPQSDSFGALVTSKLYAIDRTIRDEYLYDVDEDALADSVLKGYMDGLGDSYADYFNREEFAAFAEDTEGEMQGIGVSIVNDTENKALQIITVFPDSPALEAGLRPGDRITYVKTDGEYKSVAELGYQAAVRAMQGKADTVAQFIAYREGSYDDPAEYSIKRGYVTEITASARLYEPDPTVGVIRITSFDSKTPDQFKAALDELIGKGAEKLIFDVRYNPGGELNSVCSVLDALLPEGPVVRTVDKAGNEKTEYTSDANEINMPMAVLANGSTASAGELFCAALRDYEKAVIVGTQTFGKGSMQTTRAFEDGSAFKFTFRYYCPPVSDNYDGVGIAPDVEVELSETTAEKSFYTLTDEEDNQLAAAYEAIK